MENDGFIRVMSIKKFIPNYFIYKMITNFVRNIIQFGGNSTFEKARLSATYKGDYYYPNESDIQAILLTLSGKDPDTSQQIGITTIFTKLESSESKIYWNYIIKNLIILDRCVENRFLVTEIANMNITYVENYVEQDLKYKSLSMDSFVRNYYMYLKRKAALYSIKNSSFNIPKEEKKNYFKQQSAENILEEFNRGQLLFDQIIDISIHDKYGLLKYTLNQYVYQLLLFTLLNLYYNSHIIIVILIDRLIKMTIKEAKLFKDIYNNFLKYNKVLVNFINTRLYIKGFSDINTNEIARIDSRIIGSIDKFIKIAEESQNSNELTKEMQIQVDLIDDELIFNQVQVMRNTISQKDYQTEENIGQKFSTYQKVVQKSITFESKLNDYQLKNINKYPNGFDTNIFKEDEFKSYTNNYSTQYNVIDQKLFKITQNQHKRESSSPQTSLESKCHDDRITIEFISPINDFDENIFLLIQNVYCQVVPKIIENIEEFQYANLDDFPDYKDDEENY
ncbi:unnamed protein product [Paramecium primaurelia]|uniref:AP180 N-terminal homology (ANTH) domain-containing protein n=1 Tax=Paramecium primaurelia TaxID=5886 RepID=A0A8S1N109_PARPR|nr:unnamed protein product [Paramecium primaurelia]